MSENPTKQELYATELGSPDDRWISVTDASRIARRQEHTIRSWIAQGVLPVNPVRVGINKKTRQVRLSDLSKLTSVIDPDAGIATDLGTLDLPSIPKQQQQVMEQMVALRQKVIGELESLRGHLQQVQNQLTEQDTSYSQKLYLTRQDLTKLVTTTEDTLRQAISDHVGHSEATLRQAIEAAQTSNMVEIEQVRKNMTDVDLRLTHDGETLREAHEKLTRVVSERYAHADRQLSQVANRIDVMETTLGKLQDERVMQAGHMGQLETEVLTQIGNLTTQVTEWQSTWQKRAIAAEEEVRQLRHALDSQGRFQQTLQEQLDKERQAREELSLKIDRLFQQNQ